jgi:thioredoxin reductase (NADPH)
VEGKVDRESRTRTDELHDITFVGGGPAGLFGAYYSGLRGARAKIIESLGQLGGSLIHIYPEKEIFDVMGYPRIKSRDLVSKLIEQTMQYHPTICLNEKVTGLKILGECLVKLTTTRQDHYSKTVVITAGNGAYVPRTLDIPNMKELEGKGIYYYLTKFDHLKDKRVLIIGGGNTAIDWGLSLLQIASKIYIAHRMAKFKAHEAMLEQVMNSDVELMFPYIELKEIIGKDRVEGAVLYNNKTGKEDIISVDAIVLSIGMITNLGPIKEWGLEIKGTAIKVNPDMSTTLPLVWAAGDIVSYPGKVTLISTNAGEVSIATNSAKDYIDSIEAGGY